MNKDIQKNLFTNKELKLIRGNIRRVAVKNKVTREYVSKIVNGRAPVRTRKAQCIYNDIQKLLNTLKEVAG